MCRHAMHRFARAATRPPTALEALPHGDSVLQQRGFSAAAAAAACGGAQARVLRAGWGGADGARLGAPSGSGLLGVPSAGFAAAGVWASPGRARLMSSRAQPAVDATAAAGAAASAASGASSSGGGGPAVHLAEAALAVTGRAATEVSTIADQSNFAVAGLQAFIEHIHIAFELPWCERSSLCAVAWGCGLRGAPRGSARAVGATLAPVRPAFRDHAS